MPPEVPSRPAEPNTVRVAVIQFAPGVEPAENLAALREHVGAAARAGARVAVAPEYSMYAVTRLDERVVAVAEPLDGPFATGLARIAADVGIHVVAGMVEAAGDGSGRIRNTLLAYDPAGNPVARYRKVHLYDAFGHKESDVVAAGEIEAPALFTVDGVTFGMQTCFDLRFPEGFRRAAAAGAQVLLLPAQWIPGPDKVDQWTMLVRARAIENTVYVAAADQAAPRGAGASMIVDPAGRVLAELGDATGVISAPIDPALLSRVRAANPSLALRRFAIVERAAE
ncbi:carbon-nitrogen hydrolase family protein [Nocardia bovistercoris]|uniref:Carbon-nitrogen hydrolase family protein n=1 Tax=Nocardia bovistercoris TaxID=2785916 RepID=A0A931N1C3_9NOCA|nr:carbon-nitrogen hydrolase family protein [Nocardia bovistercoris]MBH0775834.1 carbon-nitrogen hydrolase family protein [Nocardia bovistercoris]